MNYSEKLENTKEYYPFTQWRKMFFPDSKNEDLGGMDQYTEKNCNSVKHIFDNLIERLQKLGEKVDESSKVALFKKAVLELNNINEEIEDLIETGEREQLCELIDQITVAAGLNPKNYGDGAGLADEWRDW